MQSCILRSSKVAEWCNGARCFRTSARSSTRGRSRTRGASVQWCAPPLHHGRRLWRIELSLARLVINLDHIKLNTNSTNWSSMYNNDESLPSGWLPTPHTVIPCQVGEQREMRAMWGETIDASDLEHTIWPRSPNEVTSCNPINLHTNLHQYDA